MKDETLKVVEITPYRKEGKYSDGRHPDDIQFSQDINEDLARRDFTINAIAYDPIENEIVDPFNGITDIAQSKIKAVLDPNKRFKEDALRLMRAIRIATETSFDIEEKTLNAIKKNAPLIKNISEERIRDELVK